MSIHSILEVMFRISGFRKRRMKKFVQFIQPTDSTRILDLGGSIGAWKLIAAHPRVTLLNLDVSHRRNDYPENIKFEAGNALHMTYADKEFDVTFSNSVIEHLTTWENQQLFAAEASRVGTKIWVQTPAYEFFLEPHYITPMVHWFSPSWRRRLVRNFTIRGWLARPTAAEVDEMVSEIRLIRFEEMKTLFPDCEIYVERWLGMAKSYTAVRTSSVRATVVA